MIISLVQTKGGVGKSTIAQGIAYTKYFKRIYKKIALVELDAQGTLKEWYTLRKQNKLHLKDHVVFKPIVKKDIDFITEVFSQLAEEVDLIIIDVPGESEVKFHTRFALEISDLVIMPMRGSSNDESAFKNNLFPLIDEYHKSDKDKLEKFVVLPSLISPQSKVKTYKRYFEEILPNFIKCLNAANFSRSFIENYNREGFTINELVDGDYLEKNEKEKARKALEDFENIAKSINQYLKGIYNGTT